MASASGYNHHRFARAVLKKTRKWEPSLIVQLNHTNWRFAESPINFSYDGPMRPFLMAVRAQVIPANLIPFLYDIQPPPQFVDGCLVVEIQDFRKTPEVKSRVVMRPAAESLAQTIDVMLERRGEVWDEQLALELESRIIAATSPPLYLGTSILATRNAVLALALTSPATETLSAEGTYRSPGDTQAESSSDSARLQKLLRAGERTVPFQPTWAILRVKEQMAQRLERQMASREAAEASRANGVGGGGDPLAVGAGASANGGGGVQDSSTLDAPPKKPKKKKRVAEDDVSTTATAGTKKKKTAAAAAAAAAAQADQVKQEEAEAKPKPKPKKKKQQQQQQET